MTDEVAAAGLADPTPLARPRMLAPFPVDALPSWASNYVKALATATQTPADLAGCCVLGVLAACGGGRAVVAPRRGWREPVNLYLLPVMPPGSRKTAVASDTTRPLYEAEEELAEKAAGDAVEALMLKAIAQKAAEKAMKAASDKPSDKDLTSAAISAARHAETIEIPVPPRLIADDVTPETVASLLAEHGGRLAIISAEGGMFDMMGGRYSGGIPVLDCWLKGHAGDPLRVDRKSRPAEYVKSPALTMLLTVQPIVLTKIARQGEFRGRGLLARFLYSLPPDNIGHRLIGAPTVPETVSDSYATNVRKLAAELAEWTDPLVLTLSEDAHKRLLNLESSTEPKLARDGEYGAIREWACKLVGATVRIAGLLHLATEPHAFRASISLDTLESAIQLGDYFAEHAQAAFGLLGETDTSAAAYLLEFIERRQIKAFSLRDLLTHLPRGRFTGAEDVAQAVDVLQENGWVIPVPPPQRNGPGRKSSPRFIVHPEMATFRAAEMAAESAESAEPHREPHSADSADNADTPRPERGAA